LAKKPRPIVLAVVADTHINSTIGLCLPAVTLDDGGTYRASSVQLYMWAAWKQFWHEDVFALVAELGARLYIVINGDLNDKNKHDGVELISLADADIVRHSVDLLTHKDAPVTERADCLFIVRGTEAHTGAHNYLEEAVARELKAEPDNFLEREVVREDDKQEIRHSWDWLPLVVRGKKFDIAHHPCTGSYREHTRTPAAERQATETMLSYIRRGETPPDWVLRAHGHYFAGPAGAVKTKCVFCPGWQLAGAYPLRRGSAGRVEPVGGLVFVCRDGNARLQEPSLFWPKRKKPWVETGN